MKQQVKVAALRAGDIVCGFNRERTVDRVQALPPRWSGDRARRGLVAFSDGSTAQWNLTTAIMVERQA